MTVETKIETGEGEGVALETAEEAPMDTDDKPEVKEMVTFTLEVLQVIKEQHAQHGLRHGDYQRYRGYCSRRLRRLRKTLNFTQFSKHRFQKKKVTKEIITDAKFLQIPLMSAERAWAMAMQLKQEANSEPRKRFHLMERLRKAVKHAAELAAFGDALGDARTKLETQAYHAWMNGTLCFELEHWENALQSFNRAKTIYKRLAEAFSEEIKAVYVQKVDEIEPSIRYCAYNIGEETSIEDLLTMRMAAGGGMGGEDLLAAKLDALISQTRQKQAATLSEVTFRGRTIPVKSEKVRVFLLAHQEAEASLASAETTDHQAILERIIDEVKDALLALAEEMKNDPNYRPAPKGGKGATDGAKVPHAQFLHTYLSFIKREAIVNRNLNIIETLLPNLGIEADGKTKVTKPQDLVRLYEGIVQMHHEMLALPGLEDDVAFQFQVEAKIAYYKAYRCLYVAFSYAQAKRWQESAALYERALTYADAAVKGWNNIPDCEEKSKALLQMEELKQQVEGKKYGLHAASILDVADGATSAGANQRPTKPLVDRLDEYVEDPALLGGRGSAIGNSSNSSSSSKTQPNLVPFPPEFQPVTCKPIFFDLALNNLEFPSLQHKMEQSKKGSTWGSWFGWGK